MAPSIPEELLALISLGSAAEDNPGLIQTLIDFGREPENFIREVVLNIAIAFVANVVFTTTDLIDRGINAVIAPFTTVRVSLTDALDSAGEAVIGPITGLNDWIATGLADALGFGGFPILVTLYVLEIALFIRVGRAAIPALTDAAGAVPVVGSLIDGAATFFIRLLGGAR
jgi:hypothetical protein